MIGLLGKGMRWANAGDVRWLWGRGGGRVKMKCAERDGGMCCMA